MKHIHIRNEQVEDLLCYKWLDVAEAIESAFVDETADMIPKTYLDGWGGDFRAMPAALGDYTAVKWVSVFPDNWKKEKHTVGGTLVLSDRRTGETLATMDCMTLTAYRTAATSAIAAKYCAPDAREFAIIGCGIQGRYHVEAYEAICRNHMSLSISLYDHDERAQRIFFNWLGRENLCQSWGRNKSVKEAVQHADVVTTLTPTTEAYLNVLDLPDRCHINAVGADAAGKRELMGNVIDGAKTIVCDDPQQALHSGELQYNEWPKLDVNSLKYIIKNHESMDLNSGVSVFDSTGVAIEDIAIAKLIYELSSK